MSTARLLTLLVAVFLACGCDKVQSVIGKQPAEADAREPLQPTYQLVTTKDGKLYRLNDLTGEIFLVTDTGLKKLETDLGTLHVGEYYRMADAKGGEKFLKYLGDGRFEKSAWAIKR